MLEDGEAKLVPQLLQLSGAGLGAMAEAEGVSFMNFSGAQRLMEDACGKVVCGEARELLGEGDHHGRVDPGLRQQVEAHKQRSDEAGGLDWPEQADGGRVKRNGNRSSVEHVGPFADLLDDLLVAAMDAVKVADSEHRSGETDGAGEAGRNSVEGCENLHGQISNRMRRPS